MKKIDIASIPEISTSVGIHGTAKQREVGGALCVGAIVAVGAWALTNATK